MDITLIESEAEFKLPGACRFPIATLMETVMALTALVQHLPERDPLLTVEDVAERLNVTKDWVWDHSSRKAPYLPVIRMSDGVLRYRSSQVDEFVSERERISLLRRKRR